MKGYIVIDNKIFKKHKEDDKLKIIDGKVYKIMEQFQVFDEQIYKEVKNPSLRVQYQAINQTSIPKNKIVNSDLLLTDKNSLKE